jgi:hypothetical protein
LSDAAERARSRDRHTVACRDLIPVHARDQFSVIVQQFVAMFNQMLQRAATMIGHAGIVWGIITGCILGFHSGNGDHLFKALHHHIVGHRHVRWSTARHDGGSGLIAFITCGCQSSMCMRPIMQKIATG